MFVAIALCAIALFGSVPHTAAAVTFYFDNQDEPGEGFNDAVLGTQRQAAMRFALGVWGGLLFESHPGETITVSATMDPMGGGTSAVLGSAGPVAIYRDTDTWYGSALANHLVGEDLNPANPEIVARFNSDVDDATVLGAIDWYYGTDGDAGADIDFVTAVLHEVAHGLHLLDLIDGETGEFIYDGFPGIYDRLLVEGDPNGVPLSEMTDADRLAAVMGNDLYWTGSGGTAGNGGVAPKVYAPTVYSAGSSVSHLDPNEFPDELMRPLYGGPNHTVSPIAKGMLADMGWTVVPEPGGLAMCLLGTIGLLVLARRYD